MLMTPRLNIVIFDYVPIVGVLLGFKLPLYWAFVVNIGIGGREEEYLKPQS